MIIDAFEKRGQATGETEVEKFIEIVDKNHDGMVSKEEML